MKKEIILPKAPAPVGAYKAVVVRQGIGFVSGQFPMLDDDLFFLGKVGAELTVEQAQEATAIAAKNVLAQIRDVTENFKTLDGLLRLDGYVASAADFFNQPTVLDAASEIFSECLGEKGHHARAAFSVSQLSMDSPVELCVSFTTRSCL